MNALNNLRRRRRLRRLPRLVRQIMDLNLSLSNFRRKRCLHRSPRLVRRIAVKIDWKKSSEKRDPRHGITGVILAKTHFRNNYLWIGLPPDKTSSSTEWEKADFVNTSVIIHFWEILEEKTAFLPPRTVQNPNFVSAEHMKRSAVIRGDRGASRREARSV